MTQGKLMSFLTYDSEAGIFYRNITTSSNAKEGEICGNITYNGYVRISVDGKRYLAHSLAWLYIYGEMPKTQIDHINHNRKDNRISNLRVCTQAENTRNASIRKDNTSGISGIYFDKKRNVWKVQIKKDSEIGFYGRYKDIEDAIKVRNAVYKELGFHENHGKK